EIGWFGPDELPEIAFDHAREVLAAWREAVRDGRTVTALPDRPGPGQRPTARGGAGAPPSGGAWGWGPRRGGEAARAGVGTRQAAHGQGRGRGPALWRSLGGLRPQAGRRSRQSRRWDASAAHGQGRGRGPALWRSLGLGSQAGRRSRQSRRWDASSGPRPGAGQGPRPLEEPGVGVPGGAAKPPEQALGRVKR